MIIANSLKTTWKKFMDLLPVLTSCHLSLKSLGHVYNSCAQSAMLQGSETWSLTKPNLHASETWSLTKPNLQHLQLMSRLHLPQVLYNLFVYDFPYDFSGIVGGYKLPCMCLHSFRSPCDFFQRQTSQRPCGNRTKTTQSLCYLHNHRTEIAGCLCDVLAGSL